MLIQIHIVVLLETNPLSLIQLLFSDYEKNISIDNSIFDYICM